MDVVIAGQFTWPAALALVLGWGGLQEPQGKGQGEATPPPAQETPAEKAEQPAPKPATVPLAVIVNPRNSITDLELNELRSYLKLQRTTWPNRQRIRLFLRPDGSPEMKVLLDEVYRMTGAQLRLYLKRKTFNGEVTGGKAFTWAPSTKKAIAQVKASAGGLSVILANDVPEGVRVLSIDGKRPEDPGYPLQVEASAAEPEHAGDRDSAGRSSESSVDSSVEQASQ